MVIMYKGGNVQNSLFTRFAVVNFRIDNMKFLPELIFVAIESNENIELKNIAEDILMLKRHPGWVSPK